MHLNTKKKKKLLKKISYVFIHFQISTVSTKLQESEKFTQEVKQQLTQSHIELQDQLVSLKSLDTSVCECQCVGKSS